MGTSFSKLVYSLNLQHSLIRHGSPASASLPSRSAVPSSSIHSELSIPLSGVSDFIRGGTWFSVRLRVVLTDSDVFWNIVYSIHNSICTIPFLHIRAYLPGILITGRRGMGKTSVAKEIARRLEADERVYACE
jgi:peroxin-1